MITIRALLLMGVFGIAVTASAGHRQTDSALAQTPPMGWNDWAHYRCGFTAQTVLDNAQALVKTGLASRGYKTVTIDDCWMQKTRDANGNLQVDPQRFPQGMKPVADAVHALGLKFGIYEDAGYQTCGGYAGSGESETSRDHFLQDARLFASWGVDYLKLDGCNMYVPKGSSEAAVYQKAYAAESAALKEVGRPIIFSESAPAYFLDTPDWFDVLQWVSIYGNLWREGWDIATYKPAHPDPTRFPSVLWNYAYNLPLGRFQKPGSWDDPDFLIGGDDGMTPAETRSQMALWSMMSAPLILSSSVDHLTPESLSVLGNRAIIAIDQDPLGHMATLIRRTPTTDVLFKSLGSGDYAIAFLNRGPSPVSLTLPAVDFGFSAKPGCRLHAENLWGGDSQRTPAIHATIASHDTEIWLVQANRSCGAPARKGAITMIVNKSKHDIDSYSRCLASTGSVDHCSGSPEEMWSLSSDGSLQSAGRCLGVAHDVPALQVCADVPAQHWRYAISGNLINAADRKCLSAGAGATTSLAQSTCGHNQPDQIWSLPNSP